MADPEPEDEAAAGGIGDQGGALGTGVGVAQVDVGDPGPHLDAAGRRAHQLGGGHHVVVDFGGEDRVEAGLLGLARDRLDLVGAPAHPGDHGQGESFCHRAVLSLSASLAICDGDGFQPTPLSTTRTKFMKGSRAEMVLD